ncbi:MAG: DMT family transporter [Desulfovibrionaceae bacterium]
MTWLTLALLTALVSATEAAWLKKRFSDLGFLEMAAFPFFYSLPLFALSLIFLETPILGKHFWLWFGLLMPLNLAGFLLHMRSIHLSPLSLTMPFLAFTPAFVILTSFLFLDEKLSLAGISGITAIVAGGCLLGREHGDKSIAPSLRRMFREKGPLCMLGASLVYSVCSVIGKKLILLSSPLYFAGVFYTLFGMAFLLGLLLLKKIRLSTLLSRPGAGIVAGLIFYAHAAFHHLAIALTKAAYMMAIKRLNGIFSVGFGWIWFKETQMRFRLAGSVLMTAGAVVIALWG